ncbi:hypothetical protein DEU38_103373 [Rhodococcus sp. AG1013]|uniref:NfeD family protein n=1 Tax=Rhodococcus sp. AG1013 TaxID=2183996 RepID=UPI000E0A76F7|nr:NfeD family protein [Rhodococcus sp. AG1013]RDI32636.1 hypothetical protein DEU38_103373 [Rhodococcus sp. AG1013]
MTTIYLACLAMGLVGIVGTLVVGETGSDVGDTDGGSGLPFLSLTTVATALFGVGVGGSGASVAGGSGLVAALTATAGAIVLVGLTRGVLLPYLLRQQSNSHIGRQAYIGLVGTVTIPIAPGGWGEVAFTDTEGNRVRARAVSAEAVMLPVDARVYIGDIDADNVHVVAVPDDLASDSPLHKSN